MARRVLLVLLALVLALASTTLAANANTNATASTNITASTNVTIPIDNTNTTVAVSFCELCRDKGQCAHAYDGEPGVFCGAWWSSTGERLACCCPERGMCVRYNSSYECTCGAKPTFSQERAPGQPHGIFSSNKVAWTILAAVALCVVLAMYLYTTRLDRHYHYREPLTPRVVRVLPPPHAQAPLAEIGAAHPKPRQADH